ncbi:hypothetical protein DFQ01_12081 [Paenibacillus cellulosilyticus]|uniref:Uncharacterized protein n=1 Tax=Paenibacillus cellulosilyticus TaxID=375489 RepID=A0A2V2YP68_9BACL|nr:hypothetical protein [Paenibacillus cellulosilyticus]PWV97894.1 hypothetical protein DFQ01_12081 [Paenibacillus cellulosilyticus]QKS46935.1 hypothetical protein HUB94_20910 [Paenibacillus cellulosilyticus]
MENNITYTQIIKIIFRLYASYICISGGISTVILITDFGVNSFEHFYILANGKLLFSNMASLIIGLILYVKAERFAFSVNGAEREVSLCSRELTYMVFCCLQIIFTIFIVKTTIQLLGVTIFFVIKSYSDFDFGELYVFIIPITALMLTIIFRKSSGKLADLFSK